MSLATSNRDGGRTNEAGHLRGVTKGFIGQVLNGLDVSQRGAGANMSVDVAIGDAIIQRSDGTYGHPAWNDAVYNQAIAAADGSNPRRDIIVMYIDYGETPSTGVANNTNGVVKITSVSGTAAGSPVDPSDATIQSAVGSGNPFIKLARVRVAAGATSISNSVIDDLRLMATAVNQGGWIHDAVYSWVYGSATTFTIAGVDATAQFPVGTRLRVYQGGSLKYFIVTGATFSTNTTVTVTGNGTYSLSNTPIDKPAYSYSGVPTGFPRQLLADPLDGYVEIARVTATGTVSSLSAQNLPPYKYLRTEALVMPTGGTAFAQMRFNNDSGTNYARKYSLSFAGATDTVSENVLTPSNAVRSGGVGFTVTDILNVSNREKVAFSRSVDDAGSGATTVPTGRLSFSKWINTSTVISRIDLVNNAGSGSFAAGTELVIYGKN